MTPAAALAFVERHGVVLAAARGPVPSVAAAVAGEAIRGSWWGHARGQQIFRALAYLSASPDVLTCRLVDGKVTLVHRRLWPALARVAGQFPADRVSQVRQSHAPGGHHVAHERPFPQWVPADVLAAARALSATAAFAALGSAVAPRQGPAPHAGPRAAGVGRRAPRHSAR